MKTFLAGAALPAVLALAAGAAIVLWTSVGPAYHLEARLPGADRAGVAAPPVPRAAPEGTLTRGPGQPAALSGTWPHFRGPQFNALVTDSVPLARQWPGGAPPLLWSIELGEGYAGAAVRDGSVYVLDYDRAASADALRCLSLADGREIWRYTYPVAIKRNHGMSRTVPAVTEDLVVALGPKCHLTCLDRRTGERRWAIDLVQEFGASVPQWYAGQCPLVEADRVIIAPGGPDALLVALDLASGKPVWKCPNARSWKMTHSSITPIDLAGRRTYVYCGKGGVAGVAADDGSLLWDTTDWKIGIATCPSPLDIGGGKIFFCGGYNAGALILEVTHTGDKFSAKTLHRLPAAQFGSTQHTPVLFEGHLYAVREADKQLVCLDLEGNEVWSSGAEHRFGLGPYLIADGLIYVLSDEGLLTVANATTAGYQPVATAQVLEGHDAWAPMTLVAGRLLCRDLTQMVCLNIAEELPTPAAAPTAAAAAPTASDTKPADAGDAATDPFATTEAPDEAAETIAPAAMPADTEPAGETPGAAMPDASEADPFAETTSTDTTSTDVAPSDQDPFAETMSDEPTSTEEDSSAPTEAADAPAQ